MKKGIIKTLGIAVAFSAAAASLAGCAGDEKINSEETAIVVNDEEIPLGEANFILRHQQSQTYYYMQMMGLSSSSLWSGESEDGKTYGDSLKESVYDDIVQTVVARQKAKDEYGITLTDEEQTTIDETAQSFMDANPNAEEELGITLDQLKDVLSMYTYLNDIKPYLIQDVDTEVSDDEAAQCKIIYARIKKNSDETTDDSTSDASSTSSSSEDETKTNEQLYAEAEQVLEKFKEAGDIDGDTANELADSVDEDFFAMSYSYGSDDTSFSSSVKEVADTLSDGQVYDQVIDDDSYYYVVKMVSTFDREATDQKKESIISERKTTAINDTLSGWQDEATAEAKNCWNKLTVNDKDVYTMQQTTTSSSTSATSETTDTSSDSSSSVDRASTETSVSSASENE